MILVSAGCRCFSRRFERVAGAIVRKIDRSRARLSRRVRWIFTRFDASTLTAIRERIASFLMTKRFSDIFYNFLLRFVSTRTDNNKINSSNEVVEINWHLPIIVRISLIFQMESSRSRFFSRTDYWTLSVSFHRRFHPRENFTNLPRLLIIPKDQSSSVLKTNRIPMLS